MRRCTSHVADLASAGPSPIWASRTQPVRVASDNRRAHGAALPDSNTSLSHDRFVAEPIRQPPRRRYRGLMGVLGEMFPGPKIRDEAGEDGDAQQWRLGPVDLDRGVVEVHRPAGAEPTDSDGEPSASEDRPPAGSP
jgi:hypothetical protein